MVPSATLTWEDRLSDRDRWMRFADCLAVGLAVSLPWSTSATSIFAALLVIFLLPTIRIEEWRGALRLPAGWLPILLCGLGAAGILWANVPMSERLDGLKSFLKLLFIPLFQIVGAMGLRASVRTEIDDNDIELMVEGDELGILVGPRGVTMQALEEVTRAALSRHAGGHGGWPRAHQGLAHAHHQRHLRRHGPLRAA